ncbi:MAG: hypothetical protein OEL76_10350 [Siculibacillus sp.]|nr:hypothetical protein [Siculibacillus sp.]
MLVSMSRRRTRRGLRSVAVALAAVVIAAPASAAPAAKRPQAPATAETRGDRPPSTADLPLRHIAGLEILRTGRDTLVVSRGSAVDNTGRSLIRIERLLTLDIGRIGAGGRDDVATPVDAARRAEGFTVDPTMPNGLRASVEGRPASGWYHVVYLRDPVSGIDSAILTRQLSSTRADRPGDARPPPGFTLRRHAPVAYHYDARTGFRPQVCYGWPQPMCVFTSAGTRPEFAVVEDLRSADWTRVRLERFMPETARIVRLQAVVTGVESGGAAMVRTLAQREGDVLLGRARGPGDVQTLIFEIATNSEETIAVRTDPGVKVSLFAVGFAMAQTY